MYWCNDCGLVLFVLFGIAGPNWNKRMNISHWMLLLPVCRMKRVYEQRLDISLEFFVVFSPKTNMKCSVQIFK